MMLNIVPAGKSEYAVETVCRHIQKLSRSGGILWVMLSDIWNRLPLFGPLSNLTVKWGHRKLKLKQ